MVPGKQELDIILHSRNRSCLLLIFDVIIWSILDKDVVRLSAEKSQM